MFCTARSQCTDCALRSSSVHSYLDWRVVCHWRRAWDCLMVSRYHLPRRVLCIAQYKRRQSGKTDYRARLRLTTQDKNKYAPAVCFAFTTLH